MLILVCVNLRSEGSRGYPEKKFSQDNCCYKATRRKDPCYLKKGSKLKVKVVLKNKT